MPYILKKSNGERLAAVSPGSLDLSTDLTLVGKNYPGYGDILNQNVVYLLENFANSVEPTKPLRGQIWYDYGTKTLKFYSGKEFKSVARLEISASSPTDSVVGNLWWDASQRQLKVFDGSNYISSVGSSNVIQQTPDGRVVDSVSIQVLSASSTLHSVLALYVLDSIIAVISDEEILVNTSDPLYVTHGFSILKRGMTLSGANVDNGNSAQAGNFMWGTAADATRLNNLPASDYALKSEVTQLTTTTFNTLTVLTTMTVATISAPTATTGIFKGNWQLDSSATLQASYADIAERYHADQPYTTGTVVVFGGSNEITISSSRADTAVAGIISNGYAHLLNANAGDDSTHPALALIGRVPCLVIGPIDQGDLLVTSSVPGHAESWKEGDSLAAVFAKAIESFDGPVGIIEVKVA
jgi:hypothetical protein